jgi:hypothetical protein
MGNLERRFFTLMWRGRNTIPLRWSGAPGPVTCVILFVGTPAVVLVYVWWANRRDFK